MAPKLYKRPSTCDHGAADVPSGSASTCAPKGLAVVAALNPGEALGQKGAQAVADHLSRLSKGGWNYPVEQWKAQKGYAAKRAFAHKLAFDPEGAWLRVQEKSELKNSEEKSAVSGWIHIWEVAALEKFPYDPNHAANMETLYKMVAGCDSRPSEKEELAKDGALQFDYSKRMLDKSKVKSFSSVSAEATREADIDSYNDAKASITAEIDRLPKAKKARIAPRAKDGLSGADDDAKIRIDADVKSKNDFLKKTRVVKKDLTKLLDGVASAQTKWDIAMAKDQLKHANPKLASKVLVEVKKVESMRPKIIELEAKVQEMGAKDFLKSEASNEAVLTRTNDIMATFLDGSWDQMKKALSA